MSEQPANVAREARSIHQLMRESLKTKDPFDRELEFQRKNLRKRYLNLLLLHPYAKESKDVENHLWMQTSYAFIASYKQRIAAIDRAIQANARQQAPPQQGQRQNVHGPVEHRKFIQKFRQFLAEEEKFWTQLVLRLRRSFALDEAQPALVALGLASETDDAVSPTSGNGESRDNPAFHSNARNPFPEDPSTSSVSTTPAERENRLAILSKALTCLGDIARYRELYNETGGRPRAGREDGTSIRRGKGRRGGAPAIDSLPRERNYEKAQLCYEQARSLVPHEGNPSHQLAIVASYGKDSFSSLVHYYRALCVRQPYETAAENLVTVLTKALDLWNRARKERERSLASGTPLPPSYRVELFKERVVVLHALWGKDLERMDSKFLEHDKVVYQDFHHLVAERHLPTDMISNAVILSQGALWKHRMIRDSASRKQEAHSSSSEDSISTEWRIFKHLIDIHYALLEVGKDELKELPSMDTVGNDLAQRISAIFRRTLPALRIASKWLRANFSYVMHDPEFSAFQEKEKLRGVEVSKRTSEKISGYSVNTARFWRAYAQFILALSQAFPANKLPTLTAPLEEDIDMRGFLPLKKLMGEIRKSPGDGKSGNLGQAPEQVHPNEEQLMRISDLLEDATALVQMKSSPLVLYNNHILFNEDIIEQLRPPSHTELSKTVEDSISQEQIMNSIRDISMELNQPRVRDEDTLTEFTDDVVHDAFEHLNRTEVEDDEDQDDEIVWDPRASISPALSPIMQGLPITPVKSLTSPPKYQPTPGHSTLSPKQPGKTPIGSPRVPITISATTAQDLLNDVMNAGRKANSALAPPTDSSGLQPALLFGSELSHRPTHSIWSAARDEQPLKYTGTSAAPHHHIYQTSPHAYPISLNSSQDMGPSIWSSSYPSSAQNSQQQYVGAIPSTSFAQVPQHNFMGGGHQRVPSASMVPQHNPQQRQSQLDPFLYSSPLLQQLPIQRPDMRTNLSSPYLHKTSPGNGLYYESSQQQAYRTGNAPHRQPHLGQSYMSTPISQIWGNIG